MGWIELAREAFSAIPTGDVNRFPPMSLIKCRRLRRVVDLALGKRIGFEVRIEDLRNNHDCVAARYAKACAQVVRAGSLRKAMPARKLTDLYVNPPQERVGMRERHRFDDIVGQGCRHANAVLNLHPPAPAPLAAAAKRGPAPRPLTA